MSSNPQTSLLQTSQASWTGPGASPVPNTHTCDGCAAATVQRWRAIRSGGTTSHCWQLAWFSRCNVPELLLAVLSDGPHRWKFLWSAQVTLLMKVELLLSVLRSGLTHRQRDSHWAIIMSDITTQQPSRSFYH